MEKLQINLDGWQDYRGNHAGILLYVDTSKQSVLPVRDQLNENEKGYLTEPNYETSTYGMKGPFNTKSINSIVKNKHRYILFGTKYQGLNEEYTDKYLIIGYMRIDKVKDLRARHLHEYMRNPDATVEPECITLDRAIACYSEDMKFFSLEDSLEVTKEFLKEMGYKGRITRQMKLLLEDENLDRVITHFSDKTDISEEYIATAQEFIEALEDDEDTEDDEEKEETTVESPEEDDDW
ncbi:MAG: hypothetical protein OCC49_06680 [Fibrobacterales bacterium]